MRLQMNSTVDPEKDSSTAVFRTPVINNQLMSRNWLHSGYMTQKMKKPTIKKIAGFPYAAW